MSKAETASPAHIGSHAGNGGQFDPVARDMRERIARVVDPTAWTLVDHWRTPPTRPDLEERVPKATAPSLAKADAIIAALPHGDLVDRLNGWVDACEGSEAVLGSAVVHILREARDYLASYEKNR